MSASPHPLQISLEAAVPLWMDELQKQGGPTPEDWDTARAFGVTLAEKGDLLQFRTKPGVAADLFNQLAKSLAVMSYCPGGVHVFGMHWETKTPCS